MSEPIDPKKFPYVFLPPEGNTFDLSWLRPRRADLTDPLPSPRDIFTTLVPRGTNGLPDYSGIPQYIRLDQAPTTNPYGTVPSYGSFLSGKYLLPPAPSPRPYETPVSRPTLDATVEEPIPFSAREAAAQANVIPFPGGRERSDTTPPPVPGWESLATIPDQSPDAGLAATVGELALQVQALQSLLVEHSVPALARSSQVPVVPPVPSAPVVYRDVQRTVVRNHAGEDMVVGSTEEVIMLDPVTGSRNRETTTTTIVGEDGRTVQPGDRISTCTSCHGFLTEPRPCLVCRVPLCPTCARYTVNKETEEVRVYCSTHAPSSGMGFLELLALGVSYIAAFFS